MNQFKARILTASILAPIIILGVLLLPRFEFVIMSALIFLYAGWEWSGLINLPPSQRPIYVIILLVLFCIVQALFSEFILVLALVWWLFAGYLILRYPKFVETWTNSKNLQAGMGLLVIIPCWIAMNIIREHSPGYLLLVLFLVWSADTGAFFAGKRLGKQKLAPNVSPGKTIEGLIGGVILTIIIAIIGALLLKMPLAKWPLLLVLAIIVALISVIGDLFESMIKRQAGVKDSGTLLPGHGGLLDRIDGMTAALPIFALGMSLFHL